MIERRHLEAFLALAETLHFGRAAKRLHLSQPAVTQTIRSLEEEVRTSLFERSTRSVHITEAGERFRIHAQRALAEIEAATREARAAAGSHAGTLTVAFAGALSLSPIPALLASFRSSHPAVNVKLLPMSSEAQLEALASGSCDLGSTFVPTARAPSVRHYRYATQRLVVVVSRESPLARQRSLTLEQLAAEPLVMLAKHVEPGLWPMFRATVEGAAGWRVAAEVEQLDAMLALVAHGVGIAFVPEAITRFGYQGVQFVPLQPTVEIALWLLWSSRNENTALASFLSQLPTGDAARAGHDRG